MAGRLWQGYVGFTSLSERLPGALLVEEFEMLNDLIMPLS